MYDSKLEANTARLLENMLEREEIKEVTPQFRLTFRHNRVNICTHKPDFLVILNDGREKLVEAKGARGDVWRIKWKLTQAFFPQYEYLINPTREEILK